MNTLLFPLCLAFLAVCLGGSFTVTGPVDADSSQYSLAFPFVPNHSNLDPTTYPNVSDYYLHIEYDANIINPIGLFVNEVYDQAFIEGLEFQLPETYGTNDNEFGLSAIGNQTITPIIAQPDIVAEIVPAVNAIQGTQITLILTIENFGTRRPVTPCVQFILPGDFVDLIGASSNRPNVTINITEVGGDYYFDVAWLGAILDGAASDLDITIDLFLHADACEAFANQNARSAIPEGKFDPRQASSSISSSTPPGSSGPVGSSSTVSSSSGNSTGNSSSSSIQCPDPTEPDFGDFDPACRPQPDCPDDLEPLLPDGACGAFCVQGQVFPDYSRFTPPGRGSRITVKRNFVDKLTDDPTTNGTQDPTVVFFFAFLPESSSLDGGVVEDSSSLNLVIILLPLFLGLLCLCCVAILIAALLAALWWFLTGREKMRTRVQWIPGRNKGGEDEGL